MTEKEALKSQLERIIKKSQKTLASARNNFDLGDYETASSKAYYAVFHIMQAALLSKSLRDEKDG